MTPPSDLPNEISPMLAKIGEPFDSSDHLFEVKWDGMRALSYVEAGGLRMHNRSLRECASRFPELDFLARLEPGVVIDGELVVTVDGKPDFHSTMRREHARSEMRIANLAQTMPAMYVVFDLLYHRFEDITALPLLERRERLAAVVEPCEDPKLVLSDGIVGHGLALFERANAEELEGIVAKRLNSRYLVGRRSDAWQKIKRKVTAHCVILGFEPDGKRDFKSLIIAMEEAGELTCVGQVGSGINEARREELNQWLWNNLRDTPLIPCAPRGLWVEPGLFCAVSYLERTPHGGLRAPVFIDLIRSNDEP